MATNVLPTVPNKLLPLAEMAANGLRAHGTSIGILQNTEEKLRAEIASANEARTAFKQSQTAKSAAVSAQNHIDQEAKQFIAHARRVLTIHLGTTWNSNWQATGFPSGSTAVPNSAAVRADLLQMLTRFLQANPGYENVPLNVTAARAAELLSQLSPLRSACAEAVREASKAKETHDLAIQKLRKRLRGLLDELSQLLGESDPVWYAFGFNAPADPSTPSTPDGLHFTLNGTTAYLDWADSRRAERYRIWKQTADADDGFVAVGTVTESDYTYKDLPQGKVTRLQVTAINAAGESQACEPVEITVG